MPDFPKSSGGATAADVWTYATRNLQSDTNNVIRDSVLSDATKIAGANLDAAVSTRAVESTVAKDATVAKAATVALDATVAKAATVALDATVAKETGGNLAAVKTRTDNALVAVAPTESSVLMDGTDKTLVEITDVKVGEVEAWLDLTPMQAGDTIVINYRRKVKAAGTYAIYASESYSGVQAVPMVKIIGAKVYRDIKISAQQTAGVNRTLDVQAVRTVTV